LTKLSNLLDRCCKELTNRKKREVRHTGKQTVKIEIDKDELDTTIKKANRLVELLREAQQIVDSLSGKEMSET